MIAVLPESAAPIVALMAELPGWAATTVVIPIVAGAVSAQVSTAAKTMVPAMELV